MRTALYVLVPAVALSIACGPPEWGSEEQFGEQAPTVLSEDELATLQSAVVAQGGSAKPYDCNSLDYGLYWYGKNNTSKKAYTDGRDISGYYSKTKPTVIYVHGWQKGTVKDNLVAGTNTSNGREEFFWDVGNVNVANAWVDAGYNVGIFHWTQLADDDDVLPTPIGPEAKIWTNNFATTANDYRLRWRKCDGTFNTASQAPAPARQLFYTAYKAALSKYAGPEIRIVGHSLGNQMALGMTRLAYDDTSLAASRKPKRVALLDPYWSRLPIKPYFNNRYTTEAIREHVSFLKSKGVVFEWTKTSGVNDLGGDANDAMIPLIGRTTYFPDFLEWTDVAGRHVAAPKLYFWSFAFAAPNECTADSTGTCFGTGRKSHSAKTPLADTARIMDPDTNLTTQDSGRWEQVSGKDTATPADDTFRCTTTCTPGGIPMPVQTSPVEGERAADYYPRFRWMPPPNPNYPASFFTFEIQVLDSSGVLQMQESNSCTSSDSPGTCFTYFSQSFPVRLPLGSAPWTWRVRTRDAATNAVSAWTTTTFTPFLNSHTPKWYTPETAQTLDLKSSQTMMVFTVPSSWDGTDRALSVRLYKGDNVTRLSEFIQYNLGRTLPCQLTSDPNLRVCSMSAGFTTSERGLLHLRAHPATYSTFQADTSRSVTSFYFQP
ncbi:hypothetical protein [Hyalangium gracile]|uniref:hypothetical protein n=1 Tax=Hyalangium gracile TaxID=394092 RepID=UPI001CCE7B69|nr:hypothetical protein [Hyalangium gracile]